MYLILGDRSTEIVIHAHCARKHQPQGGVMPSIKQNTLSAIVFAAAGLASEAATAAGPYILTDLGPLGGPLSAASALNRSGTVVGSAYTGSMATHAALWSGGAPRDLGTLGGSFSTAYDINNAGVVAGSSGLAGSGGTRATLWRS